MLMKLGQRILNGVGERGQRSGGATGPEGSIYVIPTMAVIALGVRIAVGPKRALQDGVFVTSGWIFVI
jgi:hypothetical protein